MNKRLLTNLSDEIKRNRLTQLAVVMIFLLVGLAIFAPLFTSDPNKIDVTNRNSMPSFVHLFGTDDLGRDYFSRALYGGRVSLTVGFLSVLISTTVGTVVGVISGYFGGLIDNLIMRVIDILMSVPNFFLIVILNTYLKPGIQNVILILGLLSWMSLARIVRSETLTLKTQDFVQYSQAIGSKTSFIMIRHLILNLIPVIIVSATLNIGGAILTESSLSFFGLGVSQPTASWGSMLNDARNAILTSPHLGFYPGLLILITVLSFNVLGETLRQAFDVRSGMSAGRRV